MRKSSNPSGDDEYDVYLRRVVDLLQQGRPRVDAIDYLVGIETEHMGMDVHETARERAGTVVGAIGVYLEQSTKPVRRFELDASVWKTEADLWLALLDCLGAPAWHGHNYGALWETVTEAGCFGLSSDQTINKVQAPFEIVVANAGSLNALLGSRLHGISQVLDDARAEFGLETRLRTL